MEPITKQAGEERIQMKLELPEGATVGSIVLVTWDVAASANAGARNFEPGAQEGRILGIEGHRVRAKFAWPNEPDVVENPLTTTIDLETGQDSHWGGIVESIELRTGNPSRRS